MENFKPQSEDYFTLTGIGEYNETIEPAIFTATTSTTSKSTTATPIPTATATALISANETKIETKITSSPYYATVFNGTTTAVPYSFLYADGIAYPNAIQDGVSYIGAFAVNGLSIKIDQIIITNNASSTTNFDLIKASPANVLESGVNILPPVPVARYSLDTGATLSLNKDDIAIVLKNFVAQTDVIPYYMTGYGLGIAFLEPLSYTNTTTSIETTTTTGTTTTHHYTYTVKTTATQKFSPLTLSVNAVAHFEP